MSIYALDSASGARPTLYTFPNWRSNPYLTILHTGAAWAGWRTAGGTTLDALASDIQDLNAGDVLHVHWTAPVCVGARDERDARKRVSRFRRILVVAAERGVRLIWTVHNEVPHEMAFRAQELAVIRTLVERADAIIQLHEFTSAAVADSYTLPATKLFTLRHSSYLGIYPIETDQESARRFLGVDSRSNVVGYVGQVRPYKGVFELLDAVSSLARRTADVEFLLAGKTQPDDLPRIEARMPHGIRSTRQHSFVSDDHLQYWVTAADVLVFPYKKVLNSGSVLLAATFGRPCVLPADTPLHDVYRDERWVLFYGEGGEYETLEDAIASALARSAELSKAAVAFARRYSPFQMSREYVKLLDLVSEHGYGGTPHPLAENPNSVREGAPA